MPNFSSPHLRWTSLGHPWDKPCLDCTQMPGPSQPRRLLAWHFGELKILDRIAQVHASNMPHGHKRLARMAMRLATNTLTLTCCVRLIGLSSVALFLSFDPSVPL